MKDPSEVVRTYDIRGVVGEQLDAPLLRVFGACFARLTGARTVLVGHDMRPSSPGLAEAFAEGVLDQGVDVTHIGRVSTDMLSYASGALGLPGAMITASHNPPRYNGVKLSRAGAVPMGWDTGLRTLLRMAEDGGPAPVGRGVLRTREVLGDYREHLLGQVDPAGMRPLRVAVEALNGMAGLTVPEVLGALPVEIVPLGFGVDGAFPHSDADPLRPENTRVLGAAVRSRRADLGLVFDGDADRCVVVDERGEVVPPSLVGTFLALRVLAGEPGATIVHSAVTSRALTEAVAAHGGRTVRARVGHVFMREAMIASGAALGVEHSGHYYFRGLWHADSGLLAALHVLTLAGTDGRPVSRIAEACRRYVSLPETNLPGAEPERRLERVARAFTGTGTTDRLDGLTVDLPDGSWFNLRPSQTEDPAPLRLNVEAPTAEAAWALRARVASLASDRRSDPIHPTHAGGETVTGSTPDETAETQAPKAAAGAPENGPAQDAQGHDGPDMAKLWELAFGAMPAQIIHAAVKLGVPDALSAGPLTAAEAAAAVGAHEPSLLRLLRGMEGVGIVAGQRDGRFALTPMGRPLCADAHNSVRGMVLLFAGEAMWRSYGDLAETVRTGRNGFERIHGMPYFDYYAQHPEEYAVFNEAMGADTQGVAPALAEGYDFSWCKTVVDVGGGNGALLTGVLTAHPGLRGIVFDRAEGVAQAAERLAAAGLDDRCEVVAGDAFTSVVPGGDLYVIKSVLHDWDDEHALAILRNCRAVLPDHGRLLVMEPLMPGPAEDLGPAHGIVSTDMDLLATTGGRVRTEAEFAALFEEAGLRLSRVLPLGDHEYLAADYHRLVEGVPA